MSVTSDTADLTAKFQRAIGELTIQDPNPVRLQQRLATAAAPLGISVYTGTIAFAGQDSSGIYQVQFNDTNSNTGYSSAWPQWAFELAKDALLAGKEVWVIANGDPFGTNLLDVFILS
jgi:hypothetical protein